MSRLRAAEDDPRGPGVEKTLTEALASNNYRVAARAAELVAEHRLEQFVDEVRAAYERFLGDQGESDPVKTDPGCEAKTPLLEALRLVGHDDGDFYCEQIRYRQIEPGYGGETDAAAKLRAIAGFALVQINDSRAMSELVDLLGDREKTARAGAARAIAHARGPASELLLRLKIQLGDDAPEVLGECFTGLLSIDPERGIDRVAPFLSHRNEDVQCEAALALGETRSPEALPYLIEQADSRQSRDYDGVLLTSIGLLGTPEAVDYLLTVVTGRDVGSAIAAVRALKLPRDSSSFADRVKAAVEKSNNRLVSNAFAEEF